MEINVTTAGLQYGGLVTTTEIKVLICYILKNIKEPVPATRLCELLNFEGIANAFEVSDAMESLEKSGNIIRTDEKGQMYTVTPAGADVAETLKTSVPLTVREKACIATLKMMAQIRYAKETDFVISREGDRTYITCSALDGELPIVSVKLLVSDEIQAKSIKNKFLENPSDVYSKIIDLFTK